MKSRKPLLVLGALLAVLVTVPAGAIKNKLKWSETLNILLADCATGAQRLQSDTAVTYFFTDDGGVFVDDSTDAADAGTGDVDPWPATPAVNDAVYIGAASQFNMVRFDIGTQGSTVMTVVWEYHNGTAWTTLTQTRTDVADYDEAAVNTHYNNFTPPSDWAETTVNSQSAYWLRQRVTAFTSHTTNAVLDQVWIGLTSDVPAKYILITSDPDETEDVWCGTTGSEAADVGVGIKAATGVFGTEVQDNAHEVYCCGDGGVVNAAIAVYEENI